MGQLPSVKKIDQDLTTSATWEDADGATVDLTIDDQSDILLIATIQASGSVSAEGGWRLVFDGTTYIQSLRQVDSEPANITLVDLVPNKIAGTYTFKLQHQIASGTLTTGVMLVAVSLHNGSGAVPANSVYVASDTVGNAWEDIPGLTCDVTLSKTSHIWAMMVFHGYHSGANKRGTFAINIDATRMEENARDWGPANQNGAVAIATRTDTEKTAGTYTVKGEWLGQGGTTLTGEDFSLVVIAAEADSGNASIDIQKDIVSSDTTTATALEDITGSSVTSVLGETAHVLSVLTLSTDVSVNNTSAYCTIQIDGTDYAVMERGHAVQQRKGSIGHVVRTTTELSSGDRISKGRWYTDSGNTLTGAGICLTSIVLAATGPAAFELLVDTGTYAIAGQDATPKGGFRALSDFGTYALAGVDSTLLGGFKVLSDFGIYGLTGQAATLKGAFKFLANTGAYSLVGVDADLRKGFLLMVDTGIYAITGQDVNLLRDLIMPGDTGAYVVAGQDAILKGGFRIISNFGTYATSGMDATLDLMRKLVADIGSYVVSGQDATILATRKLIVNTGGYILSGQSANLLAGHLLSADTGAYALTGIDALLLRAALITANTGVYLVSGVDANLLAALALLADSGVYVISGQDATLIAVTGHPAPLLTKVAWRFSVRRKRGS